MRHQPKRSPVTGRFLPLGLTLALLALLTALPVAAADHGPNYYKRTGTKPPISGEWLLGFGVNYVDKFGAGGMAGYHFKDAGITVLGSVSAIQLQGQSGTTDFRKWCQTFKVPYSIGDRTEAEFAVNVLFTLKKYK
jgi:hypothetical protein